MPTLNISIQITDEERENFLTRLAGGTVLSNEIDRKATATITGDGEEDGPAVNDATDKFGVPWDARFHGVARNQNKDGSWKRTKGLSDAVKAEADAYETAAKAAHVAATNAAVAVATAAAAPVAAPVTAEAPVTAAAPAGLPGAAAAAPVGMPGMPGAELPAPVAVVAPAPISYEEVVAKWQQLGTVKPAVAADWQGIYAAVQITDANVLKTDETVRRRLADHIDALIAA